MVLRIEKPSGLRQKPENSSMSSFGIGDYFTKERYSTLWADAKQCRSALAIEGATVETGISAVMAAFTGAACLVKLEGDLIAPGSTNDRIHEMTGLMMPGGMIGGLASGILISPDLTFEGAALGNSVFGLVDVAASENPVKDALKWYSDFLEKWEAFKAKENKLRQEQLERQIDHDLIEARTREGWKTDNPKETSPKEKPSDDPDSGSYVA